jgi:hypothetical protein
LKPRVAWEGRLRPRRRRRRRFNGLAEFPAVQFAVFKIFGQTSDETFHTVILPSIGTLLLADWRQAVFRRRATKAESGAVTYLERLAG